MKVTEPVDTEMLTRLPEVLVSLGLQPLCDSVSDSEVPPSACYIVMLDGRLVGRVPRQSANRFVEKLRMLKIQGQKVRKLQF